LNGQDDSATIVLLEEECSSDDRSFSSSQINGNQLDSEKKELNSNGEFSSRRNKIRLKDEIPNGLQLATYSNEKIFVMISAYSTEKIETWMRFIVVEDLSLFSSSSTPRNSTRRTSNELREGRRFTDEINLQAKQRKETSRRSSMKCLDC
jgi:hypothetical protein